MGAKTKKPYWPTYHVDMLGRDSPGMNTYNPKRCGTTPENPNYSVKKAKRFRGIEERNREMLKDM